MKTMLLIYNPRAGKGKLRPRLSDVLDVFTKAGWLVTVRPTQGAGDAARMAHELGGEFDRVVCCGGDGTLHEVVGGLLGLETRPELGYIPAGTTNDFSRNLNLPRGVEKQAAAAARGVPRRVDIGRFNGEHFVYVAAFGAFTDVAYDTPQQFKNMFGHLAYLLEGVTRLGSLKSCHVKVEHDGGELEGDYLFGMASNTVSVGGLLGLPKETVALDDGLLEVVLVETPRSGIQLQSEIAALLKQTADEKAGVIGLHTSRLKVICDEPVPWTLDGEYGGKPKIAEIWNEKQAMTIIYGR